MINFLSQYPLVKWILIGFGILYFLDKYGIGKYGIGKYGIFSPIDNLINRIGKYKFKSHPHLNDPKLKEVITFFNKKQFSNVEQTLKSMNSSQRSFAFESLGQYGDIKISAEWINKDLKSLSTKIIELKAMSISFLGCVAFVQANKKISLKDAQKLTLELDAYNKGEKKIIDDMIQLMLIEFEEE